VINDAANRVSLPGLEEESDADEQHAVTAAADADTDKTRPLL
jgi:hypothetical protein